LTRLLAGLVSLLAASSAVAGPLELVGQDQTRLMFSVDDIRWASDTPDNADGPAIAVSLRAEAADRLQAFTSVRIGQTASLMLCGTEVAQPVIMAPITEGYFLLTGLAPDELPRVVRILYGEAPCPGGNG
jgi:preprotein translocase subunit SecD